MMIKSEKQPSKLCEPSTESHSGPLLPSVNAMLVALNIFAFTSLSGTP
jgi:hypothetical protein